MADCPPTYALVLLHNLRVKKFYNEDDFRTALGTLYTKNIPYIALKYNKLAETYAQQEELDY